MAKQYRETLETSQDFSFWRGLVEDLDISALVGEDEHGRLKRWPITGRAHYLGFTERGEHHNHIQTTGHLHVLIHKNRIAIRIDDNKARRPA
jgi:hypothetical protein